MLTGLNGSSAPESTLLLGPYSLLCEVTAAMHNYIKGFFNVAIVGQRQSTAASVFNDDKNLVSGWV